MISMKIHDNTVSVVISSGVSGGTNTKYVPQSLKSTEFFNHSTKQLMIISV